MKPLEYLRILRQRWWVLPLTALLGFAVAFATQPAKPNGALTPLAPPPIYRATTTLITDPVGTRKNKDVDWDRVSLLATTGDVPNMVARLLRAGRASPAAPASPVVAHRGKNGNAGSGRAGKRRKGDPRGVSLRNVSVTAAPDAASGSLALTAAASSPVTASKVANAFGSELLVFLNAQGSASYNADVVRLNVQRNQVLGSISLLDAARPGLASNPFGQLANENARSAAVQKVADLDTEILSTTTDGPSSAGLRTLEEASSWTAVKQSFPAPTTPLLSAVNRGPQRLLLGGLVGLLAGIAGLLIFELFGARLRDVASVESATHLPVIAEVPEVKLTRTEWFRVLAAADPSGLVAEAYRSLRTSLLTMWQRHPAHGTSATIGASTRPLRTLLITSSSPAEGKSVSAVNLAATFAETGASVIVLDADFRRPQLDRYFSRPTQPNLGDLGPRCTPAELEAVLQESGIPGVRFAASAPPKSAPADAMAAARGATVAARDLADMVILDSPPLLLANDASELATIADATVLLVRSGWTRRSAVARAADLLRRLEATVVGSVLVGVQHSPHSGYYGYYGYYGYGYDKPEQATLRHRLFPWRRNRADAPTPAGVAAAPARSTIDGEPGDGTAGADEP